MKQKQHKISDMSRIGNILVFGFYDIMSQFSQLFPLKKLLSKLMDYKIGRWNKQ